MKLGKTGIDISRIGLGTWSIGGGSAWGGDHELQTVVDTIREAPKAGVSLIETAPGYNFGNSEKILGKALEKMNREEVVIITKCGVTWDQEMKGDLFNKVNGIQLYKNLNSESVKKEIVGSLERLGTDYVDVYMTHWQSVEGSEYYVPIQKTMDVLKLQISTTMIAGIVFSIAVTLFCILFARPLLLLIRVQEEVLPLAVSYL